MIIERMLQIVKRLLNDC